MWRAPNAILIVTYLDHKADWEVIMNKMIFMQCLYLLHAPCMDNIKKT